MLGALLSIVAAVGFLIVNDVAARWARNSAILHQCGKAPTTLHAWGRLRPRTGMSNRITRTLELPRRALSLLTHGAEWLRELVDTSRRGVKTGAETAKVTNQLAHRTSDIQHDVSRLTKEVRGIEDGLRQVHDRLLQYNLQLGRFGKSARDLSDEEPHLSARSVPLTLDEDVSPLGWNRVGSERHPDPEGREWLAVPACPFCDADERTLVNEFNKLVLMDKAPDDHSARYDFSVCHACGISYATRRPFGKRYKFLLANFGEVTAKHGGNREFTNPMLNPYPLTDRDREELKTRAAKGVFVSEHLGLRSGEYLEGLVRDRLENSVHVDLLGALVVPHKARILEIRPRTGMISESLGRLFGAEVNGMTIWESQRFLLEKVYGMASAGLVDYDQFTIPYEG